MEIRENLDGKPVSALLLVFNPRSAFSIVAATDMTITVIRPNMHAACGLRAPLKRAASALPV